MVLGRLLLFGVAYIYLYAQEACLVQARNAGYGEKGVLSGLLKSTVQGFSYGPLAWAPSFFKGLRSIGRCFEGGL